MVVVYVLFVLFLRQPSCIDIAEMERVAAVIIDKLIYGIRCVNYMAPCRQLIIL